MGKLIQIEPSRKHLGGDDSSSFGCMHKRVLVLPNDRHVRCAICGELLDPFDVLMNMVQGHKPDGRVDAWERPKKTNNKRGSKVLKYEWETCE